MTTTATTFWKLIEDHNIEIPKIQRDYTYGRDDFKIEQIRKVFIEKLIKHLVTNSPLHLDFVYGKLAGLTNVQQAMENRRAIGGLLKSVLSYAETLNIKFEYALADVRNTAGTPVTTLLPLDGQQRLTTLFLLHWYIASRLGLVPNKLGRFTYNTRKNAKDFCSELVKKGTVENDAKDLGKSIANNEWFFVGWKKDPTVASMLVVLNEIHNNLAKEPKNVLSEMWERLTTKDVVTFSFLDTQQLLMTDELYVKMNARGKQLTDYENLKSWLQETHHTLPVTDWQERLDTIWTDIFWYYRKAGEFEIDDAYYKFFKEMALSQYALGTTVIGGNLTEEQRQISDILRGEDFIPHSYMEDKKLFAEPVLICSFSFLSLLENSGHHKFTSLMIRNLDGEHLPDMVKVLFGSSAVPKLWDRVFIFAFIQFIVTKGMPVADYKEIDDVQCLQWVRVVSNLIYNTTIDSPELLLQALKAIGQIAEYSVDVYQKIADETNIVPFFDKLQVEEERSKCKLIINDTRWEILLDKYEQHSYFYGRVGFILELATTGGITNIDQFTFYAERASAVFLDDVLMREDFLLQRALLAHHEYIIEINDNNANLLLSGHGTLRLRSENWRKYFEHRGNRRYFKTFLDKIDPEKVEICLEQIINTSEVNGWCKAIVDHPRVFAYCESGRLQWVNKIDNPDLVMVLGSTKRSGYHAELFSYCFRLDYANRFHAKFAPLKLQYQYVKGGSTYPYAYIGDWAIDDLKIRAGVYYSGSVYQICVFDIDDQQLDAITANDLTNRGYTLQNACYQDDFANADDCYTELESLCELFNECTISVISESTIVSDTEI